MDGVVCTEDEVSAAVVRGVDGQEAWVSEGGGGKSMLMNDGGGGITSVAGAEERGWM
jgi:hypothetical protein